MSMVRWYIKENQRLIAAGKPPLEGFRYKIKRDGRYSRAKSRSDAAIARHKGDTPHGLGRRRPRDWRQALRRRRKAQKEARRAQR